MENYPKEVEWLISQRDQLVNELSKTNATFQKIVLAFFTGLITIVAAESFYRDTNNTIILFLIQVTIMMAIFIEAVLITGNNQRYYISAIDDYLHEKYEITALIYEGTLNKKHTIGKGFFTVITTSAAILAILISLWLFKELSLWHIMKSSILFIVLFIMEMALFLGIIIYNFYNKLKTPQIYKDCIKFLKRDGSSEQ